MSRAELGRLGWGISNFCFPCLFNMSILVRGGHGGHWDFQLTLRMHNFFYSEAESQSQSARFGFGLEKGQLGFSRRIGPVFTG